MVETLRPYLVGVRYGNMYGVPAYNAMPSWVSNEPDYTLPTV